MWKYIKKLFKKSSNPTKPMGPLRTITPVIVVLSPEEAEKLGAAIPSSVIANKVKQAMQTNSGLVRDTLNCYR
jgi:hypothetical protein